MKLVLIIDNYDSFVYNIAHCVAELGSIPIVIRNDEISIRGIERLDPDRIIISSGSGAPEERSSIGVSIDVVKYLGKRIPILGIGLGHQIIGYVFGAAIRKAKTIMHGKIDTIEVINYSPIFANVPKKFRATRYNSLVIDKPFEGLVVDAISTTDGEIMAIHHISYPIYGVQFHPESIGTEYGKTILKNFLDLV